MDDSDEPFVPFDILDSVTQSISAAYRQNVVSYDENAATKAFNIGVSSHGKDSNVLPRPLEVGAGIDAVVYEDVGGDGVDEDERKWRAPPLAGPPSEMEGVPGEWQTVASPVNNGMKGQVDDEGVKGWVPERVSLPPWAVDTKVVSVGADMTEGLKERERARVREEHGERSTTA